LLDLVDKAIKQHILSMAKINGKQLPVYSVGTADQDDQPITQAGLANTAADRIQMPFLSLVRMPDIEITDSNITKRVHNYKAYKLFPNTDNTTMLTYYRATLKYVLTIFAENRKVSEDIMTGLYHSLRNNCLVTITIHLPIKDPQDQEKTVCVQMDSDIVMGDRITQVFTQDLSKMQIYKCRIEFSLQNVNVYSFIEEMTGNFNIIVQSIGQDGTVAQEETVYTAEPIND
jgi:hypothetical protein